MKYIKALKFVLNEFYELLKLYGIIVFVFLLIAMSVHVGVINGVKQAYKEIKEIKNEN